MWSTMATDLWLCFLSGKERYAFRILVGRFLGHVVCEAQLQ
jgi:hypothetical protein